MDLDPLDGRESHEDGHCSEKSLEADKLVLLLMLQVLNKRNFLLFLHMTVNGNLPTGKKCCLRKTRKQFSSNRHISYGKAEDVELSCRFILSETRFKFK